MSIKDFQRVYQPDLATLLLKIHKIHRKKSTDLFKACQLSSETLSFCIFCQTFGSCAFQTMVENMKMDANLPKCWLKLLFPQKHLLIGWNMFLGAKKMKKSVEKVFFSGNKMFNQHFGVCTRELVETHFCQILHAFSSFFQHFSTKTLIKHNSTSLWSLQHPNAGHNIKQLSHYPQISDKFSNLIYSCLVPKQKNFCKIKIKSE